MSLAPLLANDYLCDKKASCFVISMNDKKTVIGSGIQAQENAKENYTVNVSHEVSARDHAN